MLKYSFRNKNIYFCTIILLLFITTTDCATSIVSRDDLTQIKRNSECSLNALWYDGTKGNYHLLRYVCQMFEVTDFLISTEELKIHTL